MDPTTAIPLHFTFETVTLSVAGLLVAWSALRRRWAAAASAVVLLVVQGLHAGRFIESDGDPWLVSLRILSLAGLAASVVPMDISRTLYASGLTALLGGTVWAALSAPNGADFEPASHALMFAGSVVVLFWVWQATRPSVRLRVLASFVSVLAVTVVVAGGTVARVAAVNARDEQYARLARHTVTVRRSVIAERDALRRRASALSPTFSASLVSDRAVTIDASQLRSGEWLVVFDASMVPKAKAVASGVRIPYVRSEFPGLTSIAAARRGTVGFQTVATPAGVHVMATAPVFRPGGKQVAADVVGVVSLGRRRRPSELRSILGERGVDIAVTDGDVDAASHPDLDIPPAARATRDAVSLRTFNVGGTEWFAAVMPLPDGDVDVIALTPASSIVASATDLVRAFLIAILAAALLAVVAALWLSARIARPILDLAEDAERVKSDFLASVSHELRTPLTPIRGYADLLRRGRVPARQQGEYLDEIGVAATRLERIIALLLDVAAIEAGKFRVDAEDVAPIDLLNEARDRWASRTRSHKIDVTAVRRLPAVGADRIAIGRVFDELLDNAIKFSPGGTVELRARRLGERVEFSVADEGPGIDAQHVEALRAAFSAGETGDTKRYGGLGLGLTFAEGVLVAHGSRLDITTVEGEGTVCSFTLAATGSVTRMPARSGSRKPQDTP